MSYARPRSTDEALRLLASGPWRVLAGGTDIFPANVGAPLSQPMLDITGVAALRGVTETADAWRIGALATWTDLVRAPLPPWFDGLRQAARAVGGVQIQNTGTILGNLCNASPAADGIPNLLAADARVVLSSAAGDRLLPVDGFVLGPRRTALRPDELATALILPKPRHAARSNFLKLGARRYLVISIAMVAVSLEIDQDLVAAARIAVGACGPVARRLPEAEAALIGAPMTSDLAARVQRTHLDALAPIDDVRGSAAYRRDAALTLVRRALTELGA